VGHERAANEGQVERFGLLADGVDLHLLVCHLATSGVKGRQEHEPSLVAVLAAEGPSGEKAVLAARPEEDVYAGVGVQLDQATPQQRRRLNLCRATLDWHGSVVEWAMPAPTPAAFLARRERRGGEDAVASLWVIVRWVSRGDGRIVPRGDLAARAAVLDVVAHVATRAADAGAAGGASQRAQANRASVLRVNCATAGSAPRSTTRSSERRRASSRALEEKSY